MIEKVREILKQYTEVDKDCITEEANLQNDLGLNSLDVINIIVDFEDAYNISIPDEEVRNMLTVKDIMNYLSTHI
ncbi:MAG: acyl carrier protein [Lachnospiraceae bacterium]|nr:acyl carrier protein [Lachnospiraceae bacterium]MBQ6364439.1 acyl carrier protein [Lachnospiraceae bacterium]